MNIEQLIPLVQKYRNEGKIIVFTNGCFDLLHAGHIALLQWAKQQGDILIVALNSDKSIQLFKSKSRPIIPEKERYIILKSIKYVDHVILFDDTTPLALLEKIRPNILVKGNKEKVVLGKEFVHQVRLSPTYSNLSTSSIIQKIKND